MRRRYSPVAFIKFSTSIMVVTALLGLTDFIGEWLKRSSLLPGNVIETVEMAFGVPLVMAAVFFWLWRCFLLRRWACEFLAVLAWCSLPVAFALHPLVGVLAVLWMALLTNTVIVAWPRLGKGW